MSTKPQKLAAKMCELAQELFLHDDLDKEIVIVPEMKNWACLEDAEAKRKAFILALIEMSLDDVGAPTVGMHLTHTQVIK